MLYTYKCSACQKEVELQQSLAEGESYLKTVRECTCGQIELPTRIVKGTSFVLEGGRWFKQGYQ